MASLEQHITFVKEQRDFHTSYAAKLPDADRRKNKHLETANKFSELLDYLSNARAPEGLSHRPLYLGLKPSDLKDLPDEQLEELSFSRGDEAEFMILAMMEEAGGIMSLDQVIVGLYRETKTVQKRTTVTSRLYRMMQKGLLFSVPSKKGVYSTEELSESEFDKRLAGHIDPNSCEEGLDAGI